MRKLLCVIAAGLLVFGVACGGGDEAEPAANEEETTEEEAPEEEAASNELEFVGTEFAFAGPESASAGEVTITFTNNGEQKHEMGVVPLKADAPPIEELIELPQSKVQKYAAGPFGGTEGPIAPGESETFTVDLSQAGSLAYVCFIQDPKTKKPHAMLGMVGSLTVE